MKKRSKSLTASLILTMLTTGTAFAIEPSLSNQLDADNVVNVAGTEFTYSGRVVTISWCPPANTIRYELQVEDIVGDFLLVDETGLTETSYAWTVPRTGNYAIRVRAEYATGEMSPWGESITNGQTGTVGCTLGDDFLVNAIIAPPDDGGFEP